MSHKKQEKAEYATGGGSAGVSRQTAVVLSVAMLIIGFVCGAIFGVMKTGPLPEGKTATADQRPART